MIELPEGIHPRSMRVTPIDFGFEQRPQTGAAIRRIDRPGNRFRVAFTFNRIEGEAARIMVNRLMRARREGLRIRLPLAHSQAVYGSPVVDGNDSEGTTLKLRGLQPGSLIKEGWWLTVIDAAGTRYLHNNCTTVQADAAGKAVLTIEWPLRTFPGDGDQVLIAAPEAEGLVTEVVAWEHELGDLISFEGFTLEERK